MANKTKARSAFTGVLAATMASLCCITPVLALIGGMGGLASTFSWIEPFRPFLIGLTVLALTFAWYQQIRPISGQVACDCDEDAPGRRFVQSRKFLGIITILAVALLSFPTYAHIFYPEEGNVAEESSGQMMLIALDVKGMTCAGCEQHVMQAVNKLPGIYETKVSYADDRALVKFDPQQADSTDIALAINSTGFKVTAVRSSQPSQTNQ